MNILTISKSLTQGVYVGNMRKQSQFNLTIICTDQKISLLSHKSCSNAPPVLRTDRNIL